MYGSVVCVVYRNYVYGHGVHVGLGHMGVVAYVQGIRSWGVGSLE